MDKLLGRLSRCYRPLGSFPQTTSSPPISTRRISIFITPVGPAPLMQDQIPILVMVCPSRKQRPAFPYQCPGFGSQGSKSSHKSARSASSSTICRCSMPLTITWCSALDYRASHVSAYLLRGFRSLMPFVQLVNSVPHALCRPLLVWRWAVFPNTAPVRVLKAA